MNNQATVNKELTPYLLTDIEWEKIIEIQNILEVSINIIFFIIYFKTF